MSQENVEIVRRGYEAFNRGDLEGMVADFAPSFEYVPTGAVPGFDRAYQGPEGLMEFVDWMRAEFDYARADIDELIEARDQVLVGVTARGLGKQSGVEVTWHIWHLWTVRDDKVVQGQGFVKREDALEAAGLRE
jgi:uncharacterized protein